MRILVAGGAGMIGSHLCEDLLSRGHEVICVDNLCTGRRENLRDVFADPGFRFLRMDIVDELPPLPPLDRIYHLASPASPVGYVRMPIETMRVNSEGTRRLLELAEAHHARFLYTSTSEIYGDPLQHPQKEDYRGNVSSIGPRSMYDEAKRFGEALTMSYLRTRRLDVRVVRIFNTYGSRSDPNDGRLVANFITQALRHEPITIYGNGRQTRSLCHVSDMVSALTKTMESPWARGEVLNLGNPDERTVLECAEIIRELAQSRSKFTFTAPAVGDDPQMRCPDIGKAREMLQWSPRVGIREGLMDTIAYFRKAIGVPEPRAAVLRPLTNGVVAAPVRAQVNGVNGQHANGVNGQHGVNGKHGRDGENGDGRYAAGASGS